MKSFNSNRPPPTGTAADPRATFCDHRPPVRNTNRLQTRESTQHILLPTQDRIQFQSHPDQHRQLISLISLISLHVAIQSVLRNISALPLFRTISGIRGFEEVRLASGARAADRTVAALPKRAGRDTGSGRVDHFRFLLTSSPIFILNILHLYRPSFFSFLVSRLSGPWTPDNATIPARSTSSP